MRLLTSGGLAAALLTVASTTSVGVGASDGVCASGGTHLKPTRINRLSKAEFAQTLDDLLGADVMRALPAAEGLIATLPDDDTGAGFANINWTLSSGHVTAYLAIANEVGVQIERREALRKAVVPCAAESRSISETCAASFIDSFAMRAYRRPLQDSEKDTLLGFFKERRHKTPDTALSALITRILMSPQFLFKQELGSSGAGCAGQLDDDSYRLASRLSYGLWGRMPDGALFEAAARHDLLDDEKLSAEIARMLNDPRARSWLQTFFRQWLHYDQKPAEGYSKDFLGTIPRTHLHDAAIEELERFTSEIVWTDRGSFSDLMMSRKVFTSSAQVRAIYGLPPGKARTGELLPTTRAGLLTRVGMLMHGYDEPSVIKRAAVIRRQILCDAISPPDPSKFERGALKPPLPDMKLTARQRWEARTSPPACQGCHRRLNPLGFSLELYDGLGRFRRNERHLVANTKPPTYVVLRIDATVVPNLQNASEPATNGPVTLSEAISGSEKANLCFVKQLTKFVTARPLDNADSDTLERLSGAMMQPGGSVQDVLVGIVKQVLRKQDAESAS